MNFNMFAEITYNISLLLALCSIFVLTSYRLRKLNMIKKMLMGIVIGLIGIGIMLNPFYLFEGVVFDVRSVLMVVSGMFFGILPTIIGGLFLIIFRILDGGIGVLPGVTVIICSAAIGIIWRHFRYSIITKRKKYRWIEFYIIGLITHIAMLLIMFMLPIEIALNTLKNISLPVIIIYPIGTLLICLLLSIQVDMDSFNFRMLENEERLRRSHEIAQAGSWELEPESDMIWASDQTLKLFGLKTKTNIISIKDVENMIHEDDRQMAHNALLGFMEDNKKYDIEYRIQPFGAGEFRYVRSIAEKQFDDKGNMVKILGVIIDMTEKRKLEQEKTLLEEQVWNHQKLESIGTLASGIAHEINNPINGILNYGQVILDSTESDSEINKYAGEIIYETNRVSEIVKNLLDFSKQSGKQHSYAQIDDIIGKTLSLVNTIFKHDDINLSLDVKENISKLKCRSQQIQQVLMNLLTNARDSLNEKYPGYHENKKINLKCHEFSKDKRKWISISIEDFGTGIPEDIKHRIFDPFFTTKDKEKGTGLGLSISYGIIKEHHGEIQVDSKESEYTKFTLILPCDNGWDINDT